MFDTLFGEEWIAAYHKELKELLHANDLPDSTLWVLLCALEDIKDGKISDLSYKYDDGEEIFEYTHKDS